MLQITSYITLVDTYIHASLYEMVTCKHFSYCCIIFFYQLIDVTVIVLLKAIVEPMSNNKELSRVFHHTAASDLKVIASALLYCIRPSRYF